MTDMEQKRGYRRVSDGRLVPAEEAWTVWAEHAYALLVATAHTYNKVLTYGQVGSEVQARSGISTTALLHNWIGEVLGRVVREAHRRGDPPLTALVVHTDDGMVGAGYREVLTVAGHQPLEDTMEREQHAANARLACYRHFDTELPPDGGKPTLAPKLQARIARQRSQRPPTLLPTCPRCFVQMPVSGICDSCA